MTLLTDLECNIRSNIAHALFGYRRECLGGEYVPIQGSRINIVRIPNGGMDRGNRVSVERLVGITIYSRVRVGNNQVYRRRDGL